MFSTIAVGDDQALRITDDLVLIASKSQSGAWYSFTRATADRCECAGFRFRHRCRHIDIAGRLLADPETLCPLCSVNTPGEDGICPSCAATFAGAA